MCTKLVDSKEVAVGAVVIDEISESVWEVWVCPASGVTGEKDALGGNTVEGGGEEVWQ